MVKQVHPSTTFGSTVPGYTTEDAYLVAKGTGHFRAGHPGRIIGMVWLTPDNGEPRLCAHVQFDDGAEDYYVYDLVEFEIISESEYNARVWP